VVSALRYAVPRFEPPPDVGDLREELLVLFRAMAGELGGPTGAACRGLIAEVVRTPELGELLDRQVMDPLVTPTIEVFRRAVVRGEVSPAALTPRVASVGSDLLLQHFLLHGTSAPEPVLVELVDRVVLPLLRGLASPAGGSG
jgi:tetracycline repressor-like protein